MGGREMCRNVEAIEVLGQGTGMVFVNALDSLVVSSDGMCSELGLYVTCRYWKYATSSFRYQYLIP
jgi:hypothetical protein